MKFRPIPITTYSLHFDESALDRARELVELGQITLVKKDRHKHYWLFTVSDKIQLEVEILLGKRKIRSFNCDCTDYKINGSYCAHIAAALSIALDDQDEKSPDHQTRPPKQLNTKAILEGVSNRELRDFIAHFASRNPSFALELKAKFAHQVELDENLHKYFRLCKRYASTLGTRGLGTNRLKKLIRYVDDLLDLADDLQAMSNFQEAFHLIYGVLRYLNMRHVIYEEVALQLPLSKAHLKLDILLGSEIAPNLRQEIYHHVYDLIETQRYKIYSDQNLYSLLIKYALSTGERNMVISLLQAKINVEPTNDFAILTLINVYYEQKKWSKLANLLVDFSNNYALIEKTLAWLQIKEDGSNKIESLINKLYANSNTHRIQKLCIRYLLPLLNDEQERNTISIDFFFGNPDLETYLFIKEQLAGIHEKVAEQIILLLEEKKQFVLLTKILIEEKKWEALFHIVKREADMELLVPNLGPLYHHKYQETEELLLELLRNFLNIHVGKLAFNYVNRIIKYLRRGQMTKFISAIHAMIHDDFADRTLLTKSLNY